MAKKTTKREYFKMIQENYPKTASNYDEVMKFVDHELELLEKKNSADKKPTAAQVANEGIKVAILEGLVPNKLYTIDEITKTVDACADLTNQKISALLRQMIADGKMERVEDKRKAYFKVIGD